MSEPIVFRFAAIVMFLIAVGFGLFFQSYDRATYYLAFAIWLRGTAQELETRRDHV